MVADSALYSADNLEALGSTPWISRVPASLGAAQVLLQELPEQSFQPSSMRAIAGSSCAVCMAGFHKGG